MTGVTETAREEDGDDVGTARVADAEGAGEEAAGRLAEDGALEADDAAATGRLPTGDDALEAMAGREVEEGAAVEAVTGLAAEDADADELRGVDFMGSFSWGEALL